MVPVIFWVRFLRLCRQNKKSNVFKFVKLLKFWKALSCHIPVSHFAKSYFINGIKENKIFAILLWQFNAALLVVAKLIWLSSKTISKNIADQIASTGRNASKGLRFLACFDVKSWSRFVGMQMMVLWHKFNISQEIWPPAVWEVTKSNSWQGWGEGQALHCQEQKSHRSSYKRSTNTQIQIHKYNYTNTNSRVSNQGRSPQQQ